MQTQLDVTFNVVSESFPTSSLSLVGNDVKEFRSGFVASWYRLGYRPESE
jgi:hypothetical protein